MNTIYNKKVNKKESVTACRICNHESGKLIEGICGSCL